MFPSHFYYKRNAINKMLDQWLVDAQATGSSKGHHAKLLKVVKDLRYVLLYSSFFPPSLYTESIYSFFLLNQILLLTHFFRDEFAKLPTPA